MKNKEQTAKQKRKVMRKQRRGWFVVKAQHDCGCCHSDMYFKSEASAKKVWSEAGLQLSAKITDDRGTIHEGIDTFYGLVRT